MAARKHPPRVRRVHGLIAVLTASTVVALSTVGLATATPKAELPTSVESRAIKLRESLGYRADLTYVRSVESATGAVDTHLGIKMTSAENADFSRRRALLGRAPAIDQAFLRDPTYAGTWMDQQGGGILIVQFSQSPAATTKAKVASLVPEGALVKTPVVTWSLRDLKAVDAIVGQDILADVENHLPTKIVSAGVDVVHNGEGIVIPDDAPASTRQELVDRYGDSVTVTQGGRAYPAAGARDGTGATFP